MGHHICYIRQIRLSVLNNYCCSLQSLCHNMVRGMYAYTSVFVFKSRINNSPVVFYPSIHPDTQPPTHSRIHPHHYSVDRAVGPSIHRTTFHLFI